MYILLIIQGGSKMKNSKVIITSICALVLMSCVGCNKSDQKSLASDNNNNNNNNNNNKSISEPKSTSKEQPNEDIEEYEIKPNITFYVLKDECFENNDLKNPNASELIRIYIRYDGVENQIYPYSSTVFLDKVISIQDFRDNLFLKRPSELKLPPNTIVSSNVLKKWALQHYSGLSSYSDESPRGLTYSKIQ